MSTATAVERELTSRAELFKALGHPTRLVLVNLIADAPRHTEELSEIVALSPGTVSHHLGLLLRAGVLESQREQYYQVYRLAGPILDRTLGDLVRPTQAPHDPVRVPDAWRQRVLETFFVRGRLVRIPAQRKKRSVILARLVEDFDPERDYPESEVNRILVDYHDDVATLRRELVAERLLDRHDGVYRRTAARVTPTSPSNAPGPSA